MKYVWSPKQLDLIWEMLSGSEQEVIVSGPVQCGKSISITHGFAAYASQFSGKTFLLCSRSERQMQDVLVKYMREAAEAMGLTWVRKRDHYLMDSLGNNQPNRFVTLLGSDASSESRARGFTAQAALLDEATLLPPEFVNSVSDRCSLPGAKIFKATNPDGPMHPIKLDGIDKGVKHYAFELTDNPMLTEAYIESLKRRYSGAMLRRMVYGEWAASEGMVYPNVTVCVPEGKVDRWVLAADWASSSVTHAVLLGLHADGAVWAHNEWVWDGRVKGTLDNREQARRIGRDLVGVRDIEFGVVDRTAGAFRRTLQRSLGVRIYPSDNERDRGIQLVRMHLDQDTLRISPQCPELARQLSNYRWDERAALIGEDKPIKEDDHGPDALRYGMWQISRARLKQDRKLEVVRV